MSDTLTSTEAAALLHVHEDTIEALARDGQVPAWKPGRRWVFSRRQLLEHLEQQAAANVRPTVPPASRRKPLPRLP